MELKWNNILQKPYLSFKQNELTEFLTTIRHEIEKIINLPVFVDNDANLMALGEAKFGAGIGHKNIICLTVGTGIGGGIILNGELFRGSNFSGAELGHMTIKLDGRKCRCGGKGCLERYASASAMIDSFLKKSPDHRLHP